MARTKTPDVEVFIHMTLINGKFDVEYHSEPNRIAMVNFALSMVERRIFETWEKDMEHAECGAAAMKDSRKKQIAKRAGGAA